MFLERPQGDSIWGTYYAPMAIFNDSVSPDLQYIDAEVVAHWEGRANTISNPMMRSRYADLVWDLKDKAARQRPSHIFALCAIDSYLDACNRSFYTHPMEGITWLRRALNLSLSINDRPRTTSVVETIFSFYDKVAETKSPGVWVFPFDVLYNKGLLTLEQESKLIAGLEQMLERTSGNGKADEFNPHGAEAAAERLSRHYRRTSDQANVQRVTKIYGNAFERVSREASPLLASAWLPPVIERYQQEGMQEDAERLKLLMEEKGKGIRGELKKFTVTADIPKDEIEKLVKYLANEGDSGTSLNRIGQYFIQNTQSTRDLLNGIAQHAPIQSLIPITIHDKDGLPTAKIGSLEEDPDGRLHQQLARNIEFFQPILDMVLGEFIKHHGPAADSVLDFLNNSPVFPKHAESLLREGLLAYDGGDFIKTIHILIPQMEQGLRRLLALLGLPTRKTVPRHPGIMDAKSMNDVLNDERIRKVLTENLWRYLMVVYIDRRGLNLRNDLAHGLLDSQSFNRSTANLVLHTMLALALLREKSADKEQKAGT